MTTALNVCRKRKSQLAHEDALLATLGSQPRPAERDPGVHDVSSALRSLSFRQRQAVILYYWGDLPIRTIAHLMGTAEGTIRSHLDRARSALKPLLEASDV